MTLRQNILNLFYPLLMRIGGRRVVLKNEKQIKPLQSFYALQATLSNGTPLDFKSLQGKKVLLVNTASDCGYTPQYRELQQLYEQHKNHLIIIGFPANDFKQQEKLSNTEMSSFCKENFGVQFPLAKKSMVIKNQMQHKVFEWLTNKNLNGWNDQAPVWNFSKYLINEQGLLSHYFSPSVSPLSKTVKEAINL